FIFASVAFPARKRQCANSAQALTPLAAVLVFVKIQQWRRRHREEFALALSKGDDFPIHQTPEPIAYSGYDRNFYDRYFFNGYSPDGSEFVAVAFGVYPALNV